MKEKIILNYDNKGKNISRQDEVFTREGIQYQII